DGTGENPYLAYLALADYVVVTADSVNMVSEACTTGKPVFVVELEGGNRKFRLFHEAMRARGYTRPFAGKLESWRYPALDDVGRVAQEIRNRLGNS
ncbi:MAG TPA: ELM1/GtrOC1 family putative glycosyltransferase, partial [Thiobacillus sp.]